MWKRLYEEKLGHLVTQSNKKVKKILRTKNNAADSNYVLNVYIFYVEERARDRRDHGKKKTGTKNSVIYCIQ
jgi:hypothetical protein